MIRLTRLNNQQITLNSDLIKLVESKPDTLITLVNGEKLLVHEPVDEVVAKIVEFRRTIVAGLLNMTGEPGTALAASASRQRERATVENTEELSGG